MREQFENMPEVHKKLKELHPTIVWFSDQENEYASSFNGFQSMVIWLNGAWYAYQEQQKKIDAITKQRDSFIKAHHIAMNDVCENKAKIDELQKLRSLDEMAINQLAQANQVWQIKCGELPVIDLTQQQRIDTIILHIHLGKQQGLDVTYLVELRQQRYLQSWDIYQ